MLLQLEHLRWTRSSYPPSSYPKSKELEEFTFNMKFNKLTVGLAAFALGIASAASIYDVTLPTSMSVGSAQLKAGNYKVEMQGDKAVFKMGKTSVEVPAKLEKSDQQYSYTSVVSDGNKLVEIDLGRKAEKIVFSPVAGTNAGGSK
jgi:hypothetical protein